MSDSNAQQIQNAGAVGKEINIKGKYAAGRDINKNIYKYEAPTFSEVNLKYFEEEQYPKPVFADVFLESIKQKKVRIIAGLNDFDKDSFIKYVAFKLKIDLGNEYRVKEWVERSGNINIFSALGEEKNARSIVVFSQLSPNDIKYDISKLEGLARQNNCYILISTDLPLACWKITEEVKQNFWEEVPEKRIYADEVLINYLATEIKNNPYKYRLKLPVTTFEKNTQLTSKYTIGGIALALGSIEQVKIFCRMIQSDVEVISDEVVQSSLKKLTENNINLILKWFNTLSDKEKEIAISLSIFTGVYDDQFFAAVEQVIEKAWKKRGTALQSLDYNDLDSLHSFFSIQEIRKNERIINSRFPNQRQELIKTIWYSHRRRLLMSLPVLESLIINSETSSDVNWELFGTPKRRVLIQKSLSETLSDIGYIHYPSVRNSFFKLASHDNPEIQNIAARSIARWREFEGGEDKLFETLDGWSKDVKNISEIIEALGLKSNDSDSIDFLEATLVLTLRYAAEYDPPNNLSEKFVEKFKRHLKSRSFIVQERLQEYTIPFLLQNHLWQLRDIMEYIGSDLLHIYRESIAFGIAMAYERDYKEVESVVLEWVDFCVSHEANISSTNYISFRDNVLITLIRSLSKIKYNSKYSFNADDAYKIIQRFQISDYHSPINDHYIEFIKKQLIVEGTEISDGIFSIIKNLDEKYRDSLISVILDLYKDQRKQLKGGLYSQQYDIRVWVNEDRPFTHIEQTMLKWLVSDDHTAQEIALDALYEFAKQIDYTEEFVVENHKNHNLEIEKLNEFKPERGIKGKAISTATSSFWSFMLSTFTLPTYDTRLRLYIKNIQPLLINQEMKNQRFLEIIAEKLSKYFNDDEIAKAISKYLKSHVGVFNTIKTVFWVMVIIAVIIMIVLMKG